MSVPQAQPQTTQSLAQRLLADADSASPPEAVEQPQAAEPGAEVQEPVAQENAEQPEGQAEPDLVEWELDGEKVQVPAKLKDYLMRDKDYRQKTMALAEDAKLTKAAQQTFDQLAQHAQSLVQQAQQLAPVYGQVTALDQQIQQIKSYLTPQLKATDPLAFNNLGTELFLLSQQRQEIFNSAQAQMAQYRQRMDAVNAQANQVRTQQAIAEVKKAIPQFSEQVSREVGEYVAKSGLPQEALAYMDSSAPAFLLAWKAAQYDRIQAEAKTSLKKVENAAPIAKPSAKAQTSESKARMDRLQEQFRKSGGKDTNLSREILREKLGLNRS